MPTGPAFRLLLSAFCLLVLACGPRPEPQRPPRPTPTATPTPDAPSAGALGDRLAIAHWRMTLETVERPGGALQWGGREPGGAQARGEFLVARLYVQNAGGGGLFGATLSLNDFQLLAPDGASYPASNCCPGYALSQGLQPVRFANDFPTGAWARLLLVFDVPPGAAGLTLNFTQDKGLTWKLD